VSQASAWRYYLGFYRGRVGPIVLSILLSVGQSLLVLPVAFLVRYAFDSVIPAGNVPALAGLGGAILLLIALNSVAMLLPRYLSLNTTKQAIRDLRDDLLSRCYRWSRAHCDAADRGRLHAVMVQDTQRLDSMSNALVALFLPAAVTALGLSAVLAFLNWRLFLVVLAVLPALYLANRRLRKRLAAKIRAAHRSFEQYSRGTLFVLQMMPLTRVQTAETFEMDRQRRHLDEVRATGLANAMAQALYAAVQNGTAALAGVLIMVIGGMAVATRAMSVGSLLSFYVAVLLLIGSLQTLLSAVPYIVEGCEALLTLARTFQVDARPPYAGRRAIAFSGHVTLEGVGFRYRQEPVLREVSLDLPAGRLVAVTGPNGAGKSTIADLILGFYRPQEGRLCADGQPYDELDLAHLRRAIGVVAQDPLFFAGTILENLTYGQADAPAAAIDEALRLATADAFIRELPDGCQTRVGDNGVTLSGGQRQRLAIARALLRRPRLLILDEPTTHLDAAAMQQLAHNLLHLADAPAILLITHVEEIAERAAILYRLSADGRIAEVARRG
jgi:ABC-type multidrug transport system fused ATPase/permease subunit